MPLVFAHSHLLSMSLFCLYLEHLPLHLAQTRYRIQNQIERT